MNIHTREKERVKANFVFIKLVIVWNSVCEFVKSIEFSKFIKLVRVWNSDCEFVNRGIRLNVEIKFVTLDYSSFLVLRSTKGGLIIENSSLLCSFSFEYFLSCSLLSIFYVLLVSLQLYICCCSSYFFNEFEEIYFCCILVSYCVCVNLSSKWHHSSWLRDCLTCSNNEGK